MNLRFVQRIKQCQSANVAFPLSLLYLLFHLRLTMSRRSGSHRGRNASPSCSLGGCRCFDVRLPTRNGNAISLLSTSVHGLQQSIKQSSPAFSRRYGYCWKKKLAVALSLVQNTKLQQTSCRCLLSFRSSSVVGRHYALRGRTCLWRQNGAVHRFVLPQRKSTDPEFGARWRLFIGTKQRITRR